MRRHLKNLLGCALQGWINPFLPPENIYVLSQVRVSLICVVSSSIVFAILGKELSENAPCILKSLETEKMKAGFQGCILVPKHSQESYHHFECGTTCKYCQAQLSPSFSPSWQLQPSWLSIALFCISSTHPPPPRASRFLAQQRLQVSDVSEQVLSKV